jgi:hypothetical protein
MKVYFGLRGESGCKVFTWDDASPKRPLPLYMATDLQNHSPTGPEWGYSGSGPAQLALALLFDATEDRSFSLDLHQLVKAALVAQLPETVWARSAVAILEVALQVAPEPVLKQRAAHHLARLRNAYAKKGDETNG